MLEIQSTYENPIGFIDAMDRHMSTTKAFLDKDYLNLVADYFPFRHIALVMYGDNFQFEDSVYRSNEGTVFGNQYKKAAFQNRDYLAQFISRNFEELTNRNAIIKSSEVLPEGEQCQKDYMKILSYGGLKYAAVLPIDRTYRLAIYKEDEAGDFSDDEIAILQDLLSFTKFGYRNFCRQQEIGNLSKAKTNLLDNMQIGYMTLDRDLHVLDSNPLSAIAAVDLWGGNGNIGEKILAMFPSIKGPQQMEKKGYMLTLLPYQEIDYHGKLHQYYSLAIDKTEGWGRLRAAGSTLPFETLTSRELEVLDAFAKGLEYPEISQQLFISEGTLRVHMKNIYRKLDVSNQRKLVYEYMKYTQL